jgi:hypothetical protein
MARDERDNSSIKRNGGQWNDVLLKADRVLLALVLSLIIFCVILVLGLVQPSATSSILIASDPIESLYQGLLTATVTGVTLVLTISQLVLSQELGAIGDQRSRLEGALEYQHDFEELTDCDVTPAEPSEFFVVLLQSIAERAESARDLVGDTSADCDFLERLVERANDLAERMDGSEFGQFDVVWLALGLDYSQMTHRTRLLKHDVGDSNSECDAKLGELVDLLKMFGVAREHFKTLLFQWELTNLSRWIMATAIPAILASVYMLAYFEPQDFLGHTAGVGHAHLFVALTTTISLVPFSLLVSYMARIMSVAQRTLSVGPFLLRNTE